MYYQKVSVLIADIPGLNVTVPYDSDEPVRLTMDRVTHKLANTALGDVHHGTRSLHFDGVPIYDYNKSMRFYGLFGKVVTYKASENVQQNHQSVKFIKEKKAAVPKENSKHSSNGQRQKVKQPALEEKTPKTWQATIVTEEGTKTKLDIIKNDAVRDLKSRISNHVTGGLRIAKQHLFYDGNRLEDKHKLSYYNIENHATIYLLATTQPVVVPTAVFVKTLQGKTIVCRISMTQSLGHLKQVIQYKQDIPSEKQCLVFEGKYLVENSKQLQDYGIRNDDTVHLTLRLLGGSIAPILFADVAAEGGPIKKAWSEHAPQGRAADWGANIEIKCKCTPNYRVVSPQGFGLYELSETPTPCPICNSIDVTPVTVGFSNCQYRIHGVKSNGVRYKSEWVIVRQEDQYQVSDDAKQAAWKRLGIESRSLDKSIDDPCTICLEDMVHTATLSCGHQFHKKCIATWKMTCPNCRAPQL